MKFDLVAKLDQRLKFRVFRASRSLISSRNQVVSAGVHTQGVRISDVDCSQSPWLCKIRNEFARAIIYYDVKTNWVRIFWRRTKWAAEMTVGRLTSSGGLDGRIEWECCCLHQILALNWSIAKTQLSACDAKWCGWWAKLDQTFGFQIEDLLRFLALDWRICARILSWQVTAGW